MNEFGEYLRRVRRTKGFTLKEVAEILEVHLSLIGYYEKGTRRPSIRNLIKLAWVYDKPYTELLKMRDENKVEKNPLPVCKQR